MQFFVQPLLQQLNLLSCSCTSRGVTPCNVSCNLSRNSEDEVKVEGVFVLADRTKHCETSCKRDVTLCNA